ncbi:hypothetical protein Abr02nite_65210 [Paractinoplanes brasiliensis]|nr:hypothetical protein Abr02nite_65210 [Actinoplanes brasiliensis]
MLTQPQTCGHGFHTPVVASTITITIATSAYPFQGLPPDAMRDTLARSLTRTKDLDSPVSMAFAGNIGQGRRGVVQIAPAAGPAVRGNGHPAQARGHMLKCPVSCDNLSQ